MEEIGSWFINNLDWLIPTVLGIFGIRIGYKTGVKKGSKVFPS